MSLDEHIQNRSDFPPEELAKYYGKHIAWNLEGTRIVASGNDDLEVFRAAAEAGYGTEQIVFSYVPFPDEVLLGGAFLGEANEESSR